MTRRFSGRRKAARISEFDRFSVIPERISEFQTGISQIYKGALKHSLPTSITMFR